MAYLNTTDERYYNGLSYPAGYWDAPDSGSTGQYVLAEGYFNWAYGYIDGYYDDDFYDLGYIAPGNYTIEVDGYNWDYGNAYYSLRPDIRLYRNGIYIASDVIGDIDFSETFGANYSVEVSYFSTTEYRLRYTLASPVNIPAVFTNPTYAGLLQEGNRITTAVDYFDANGNSDSAVSTFFYRDGILLYETADPSIFLIQADVGKSISFRKGFIDDDGFIELSSEYIVGVVANTNDLPTGKVRISGSATQGQLLTASNTLADDDGLGAITYVWKANGIEIEAGSTLLLSQNEVNATITVTANYTDQYGTEESVTSAATSQIRNLNDLPTGAVSIGGNPSQGETLTASNTLDDEDGLGPITYTWRADGVEIATGETLTLTQEEVGTIIEVVASYTDQFDNEENKSSVGTSAVKNTNDEPVGSVTIVGTAVQGQILTAMDSLEDLDGLGEITYTWYADEDEVGTDKKFELTQQEVGKTITVTASYTDGYGFAESVESLATVLVASDNNLPTGAVVIEGVTEQGQTLIETNTLNDADAIGEISYTWYADGVDVGVGDSLLLTQAQVGKAITVAAAYTDGAGVSESVTSELSSPVSNVNDAPELTDLSPLSILTDESDIPVATTGTIGVDDPDGDQLQFSVERGRIDDGSAFITRVGSYGTLEVDSGTGDFTYTPNMEKVSAATRSPVDLFFVSVTDGELSDTGILEIGGFDTYGVDVFDPNGDGKLWDAYFVATSGEELLVEDLQLFRTYGGVLGRTPDPGGFRFYQNKIAAGEHDLYSMTEGFLWSREFMSYFPDATRPTEISSTDFVNHIYINVFGREPDAAGFAYWTNELDSGMRDQANVAVSMTQSNEFVALTAIEAVDYLIG